MSDKVLKIFEKFDGSNEINKIDKIIMWIFLQYFPFLVPNLFHGTYGYV